MKWLFKIIHLILDHKSDGEASPTSVKVARYTTVAAVVGSLATIFPIIWEKPPWWLHDRAEKLAPVATATEPTADTAVAMSMMSAPHHVDIPTILWWAAGIGAISMAYEIFARYKLNRAKLPKPERPANRSKILPE